MTQPYSVLISLVVSLISGYTKIVQLFCKPVLALMFFLWSIEASAQFTITENFKGSSAGSNIILGGSPNPAKLTSGIEDPVGAGWLRLNGSATNQRGYAYVNTPFPSTLGVFIDFEYKTWRSLADVTYNGADGIGVFLFDAAANFSIGGYGGSLGYAPNSPTTPTGLAGGYMGIGLDEYGNYSNPGDGGKVGGPGLRPNSVALRGPTTSLSSTTNAYLTGIQLNTSTTANEIDYNTATTTRPTDAQFYRRVQIEVVPSGANYVITVRWTKTPNGVFTQLLSYTTTTPPPANLKLGFAASTGGGFNTHEIRNLLITTPGGFRADKSVDKASTLIGQKLTYTINAYNSTTAAITGLKFADTLKSASNTILTNTDFNIESITFNNNGFTGTLAAGYTNGVAKTTGLTNPFTTTLNMAASSKATFTVVGTVNQVPSGGIIKNSVGIDPSATGIIDKDLTNNYFTVATNILSPNIDFVINKTADNFCADPVNGNTYTLTVSNAGANASIAGQTVTVTDVIPAGFIVKSTNAVAAGWTVSNSGNTYTFTRTNSLASGFAYPSINIAVTPPSSGTSWNNTATVAYSGTGGGAELNVNNNTSNVVTLYGKLAAPVVNNAISYCQGATAVPLTATGVNLKWYTVAVGGTGSSIAPTPLTTTAGSSIYYVSQSNGTCESPLSQITVTVQPVLSGNTISANQTICSGLSPAQLTGGTVTGGSTPYTYRWEQSINGGAWTNATGTNNLASYAPSALTTTTAYRRVVTGGACDNTSEAVTITVQPALDNNIITPQTILSLCGSGDPGLISGSTATGGTGTPSYQWQSSIDGTNYTNIAVGGTSANYDPGAISVTTWYRRVVTSGACAVPNNSAAVKFTVYPLLTAGSIGADQIFCQTGTPLTITQLTPAGGGSSNYTYQWQSSTLSSTTGFTDIINANQASYSFPAAINQTTYYRRTVNDPSSGCGPVNSNVVTITINPQITGNTLNAPALSVYCASGNPAAITGAMPGGGNGAYIYSWEQSINGGSTWTIIGGAGTASYDPPSLNATTMFRRTVSSGTCLSISVPVTFTIYEAPTTANAGADQQQCAQDIFQLAGNVPGVGTGVWTVVGAGPATIANANLPNTTVTLEKGKSATLRWTISNGTCASTSDDVVITNFDYPTTTNAGVDITQYNSGTFTLNGNVPTSGTGVWTVKAGSTATIASSTSANTTVTIAPGTSATLIWTVSNGLCAVSSDEVMITYSRQADIKVIKSIITPGPFVAGQAIVYRIVTTNNGPSDATGLKILDNVPTDIVVSGISANASGTATITGNTSSGNVVNVTADLAADPGSSITVDVNGTIAANYSGSLSNTATVTSPIVPDPDGATSTVTNQVDRKPVLSLLKNGPSNVIAGDAITYKITISNTSTSNAIGTAIKDIIPSQIENVSWVVSKTGAASFTGNANNSGNNISFTGDIPAGPGNTIVIDVTGIVSSSATGNFVNTATATPSEAVPPVNSNTVVTTISSKTGLVMLKNGPATAEAGSPIAYTLKITNNGLSDAINASITDIIPAEIKTVSWTATVQGASTINGTASGTGNNINLTGNVPAGAVNAILLSISGTVDPSFSGNISNTATASPSEAGGVPSSSTVTTQVNRKPEINITKTGAATLIAGGQVNYTIEVTNTSLADAKALVITDAVPVELKSVSWNTTTQGASIIGTGNGTGNAISVTGNLPTGAGKIIIHIIGTLDAGFSGTLSNTAKATPAEQGTIPKTATSTAQVSRVPVLSILKTGPATITSGQQITYTVTVTNTGISDAVGLTIADIVPASIKNVSWTSTIGGAAIINAGDTGSGNNVSVNADIPAGAANKVTLTIRGTVDASFNGSVINTATATPSENSAIAVSSTATTTTSRKPELTISKTGPATLVSGQNITYTIVVNNFSSSDAKALVITDQVPVGVGAVTWSAVANGTGVINGAANGAGNNISLNADLPAGAANNITLTVNGKVAPSFSGQLSNTATATPAENGAIAKSATSTTTISRIPTLSIQKTGPASISAGQQVHYSLTITNTGSADALQAVITDVIPSGISNVSWTAIPEGGASISGTASGSTNALSFNANIPAGLANIIRVNIQGDVSSAATGSLVNTATVTPSEPGSTPESSTATTTLNSVPGIILSKSGPSQISAGQTVTYSLIASNSGPSDATNLSITDAVPLPLTNVSWTAAAEGTALITIGATGNGSNVAVRGNIAAGTGNRILITITGQVPSNTTFSSFANSAKASPSELDVPPVTSNTITTTVNKKVNISAIKSATAILSAGENITYLLEVKNNGPSDAQNLLVTDQIPFGILNVTWTATATGSASIISGGTGTGNSMSLRANVPSGNNNVILVTITGKVDPNFSGTELKNTFIVTPSEPENPVVTSNTTTTNINKTTDIQIQKIGPANGVAGRVINYTITVNNVGPSNASAVNIIDQLPAGITDVNWTATTQNGAVINNGSPSSGNTNGINIFAAIPANSGIVTINVSGTIDPSYSSATLINTATASPEVGIVDPTPATSTVNTLISRSANVRIVKSGPANITAGEPITYTLRIVNDGPSFAPGVLIRDLFPGNSAVTNVSWTAQALTGAALNGGAANNTVNGSGNVSFSADIPSKTGIVEVTINGTVSPAATGAFVNTATALFPVGSPITDSDLGSNTSSVTTAVVVETNLAVSKSGPSKINIGDPITYTIEVKNKGLSNITDAAISDIVPNSVSVSNWTAQAGNGASIEGLLNGTISGTGNAIITYGDIPSTIGGNPPSIIVLTIHGIVKTTAEATFTNTVSVEANGVKESAVVTALNQSTDVYIEKNGPQSIIAGSSINYQIKVGNDGPINVAGLSISDVIPSVIKNVSWTTTTFGTATITGANTGSTNNIQTIASIDAGVSNYILINVQGTVDPATNVTAISNTANVTLPAGVSDFNLTNNTSTVSTVVTSKSGFSVRKMGPADAISGSEITYTIIVSNAGPSNAVQTVIKDVVPANIKNVSWTSSQTGAANITTGVMGNAGADNVVSLTADFPAGAGNEVAITIKGTIDPGYAGSLVNNALVTPSELNNPPITSENVSTNVTRKSALSIVKTGPSRVDAGTTLQYQLIVNNTGPSNAVGAIITDQIPAGLTNVRWTTETTTGAEVTAGATGNASAVNIVANFLAGTGTLKVTILADVPANSSLTSIQNTAKVTPAIPDANNPSVTSNEVITEIVKNVNLEFAKSGPSTLNAGENITYTLAIRNAGPSNALGARLTDAVPAEIKNVSWTTVPTGVTIISGASGTGNNVDLTADIPVGGTILVNVKGIVDPLFAGVLTNTATLSPAEPGEAPLTAEAVTTVKKLTRLQISKSGPSAVVAGQFMNYEIKVSNNGPSTALNALITDAIPVQLSEVSWIAIPAGMSTITEGVNGAGNSLSVRADIPVGSQNEITIQVTGKVAPDYGGTLSNIATATPSDPDNTPVVTPPVVTDVTRLPQIILSKTGPVAVTAGGEVIYTIEANNTGLSDASNLIIADAVPLELKNVSWSASVSGNSSINGIDQGSGNTISINTNIPSGPNNKVTIMVKGTVDPAFVGTISNMATAKPSELPGTVVNSPEVQTEVKLIPVIVVHKTGPATVTAGGAINYVIELSNTGLSNAKNLVITDQIDPKITGVSWTATTSGLSAINGSVSGTGSVILNGNIPAGIGNKISISITGTILPGATGKIINTAAAKPSEAGIPEVPSNPVETNIEQKPVVQITKSGPGVATAGGEVTYIIEVVNTGLSDASGISISDNVSSQLSNVSWTSIVGGTATILTGGSGSGNTVLLTANIPAGQVENKVTITIKGTVKPDFSGKLQNIAIAKVPLPGIPEVVTPPVETEVDAKPGIVISKNGASTAISGSEMVYTITVRNTGLSNAKTLSITDHVPALLTGVSWTSSVDGTAVINSGSSGSGNTVALNADIPAGVDNLITIIVKGTIDPAFNGNLTNIAVATPSEPGIVPVNASKTTVVSKTPVLSIIKNGPGTIAAGNEIIYTLNIQNPGTANADNALITDAIPVAITNVTWEAVAQGTASILSGATGNTNNLSLNVNVPGGAGNGILVTIKGVVNASATADLVNKASVTPSEPGTVASSSTVTNMLKSTSSVSLVKNGPTQISAGQTLTYTLVAGNNGPSDARGLAITDVIPSGLTNVSWTVTTAGTAVVTEGGNGTGNNLLIKADLPAGAANQILVTITGKVLSSAPAGILTNTAVATPSEPGNPPVNSNTITTTIDKKLSIRAVKSAVATVTAGESITYALQVHNDGPTDAVNLSIKDNIPAGINNVSWTTTVAGAASIASNGTGTGTAVNLNVNIPAGAENFITVFVTGTVDPAYTGLPLKNSFTVTPAEPGNPVVVSEEVITNVEGIADIQVQKTGPSTVVAGSNMSYVIDVKNAGPSNAAAVNVVDNLPPGFTVLSWTATALNGAIISGPATGNGNVNVTAAIPSGTASVQIIVNGKVNPDYVGTSLVNTATATPEAGVIDHTPASSTVNTSVGKIANIRITKSGPADIAVGDMMTYNLRIVNDGPSDAVGVLIKDVIPANLEAGAVWTSNLQGGATLSQAAGNGDVDLIGNIPTGTGLIEIKIIGKVKADNADKIVFSNTATAFFPAGGSITDPDLSSNTSSISTVVNNDPVLKVSKSGPAKVNIGDPIEYTIIVKNGGAGNIVNASIADPVPADVSVSSWTATVTGGATLTGPLSGNTNTILTTADIPADGNVNTALTIKVTGIVKTTANAIFTNTVTVTANGERSSSVVTAVNQSTDIKVEKSGPQAVIAGAAIAYTIKVTNQGPRAVEGLIIRDNIPVQIDQISWSAQANGAATINGTSNGSNNNLLVNADVPIGAANFILITVNGTVNANTVAGSMTNIATATLPVDVVDFNLANNSSEVRTQISSVSGLKISKSGPQNAVSGTPITYTIKVRNDGFSNAKQAIIKDVVPAGINNVNWSASATGTAAILTGANGNGSTIQVTADIPAGAGNEVSIIINGIIDAGYTGVPLVNTATVTPSEEGNPPVTSVPVSTDVENKSGLKLIKTGPSSIVAGTNVIYTLELTNTGPSNAINADLLDDLLAPLTNVSWTSIASNGAVIRSGATGSGNKVNLKVDLPAGAAMVKVTISASVPANATGSINNVARVTPTEPGNPQVPSNPITTDVVNSANLSLQKSGPSNAHSGETITYTLTVENNGPSDAVGLKIADVVPPQLSNVSWTSTINGGAVISTGASGSGSNVLLTANVPANGSVVVLISAMVDPLYTGAIINTASLTPADPGKPVINSIVTTTIKKLSSLRISKNGSASVIAGQTMTYQIVVRNGGPGTAQNAVITDAIPSGISNVTWNAVASGTASISNGQTGIGNALSVTASIPSGTNDFVTINITGTVKPEFTGKLSNIATVTPQGPDENPQPVVSPPVETQVNSKVGIVLNKKGPATVSAGEQITYVIELSNTGPSNAVNLAVTDNVPLQITDVKWTTSTSGGAKVTAGAAGTGNTVSVNADVTANSSDKVTITVTGKVLSSYEGTLSNVAKATPSEPGNIPIVTPPVETVAKRQPKIAIMKTAPSAVKSGDLLTYTIEVANIGPSDAKDLMISDLISSNIVLVKWTTSISGSAKVLAGATGSSNNLNLMADIPAGNENKVVITVTGMVLKTFTGTIMNTARGIPSEATPEVSSNTVETIVDVADFIIPNIITPNNDGSNDTFKIKGIENYPGTQVTIFNRWGNEVFRSNDYKNDWDGNQLNEGTYYYIVSRKEKTGNATVYKGWLFIKR